MTARYRERAWGAPGRPVHHLTLCPLCIHNAAKMMNSLEESKTPHQNPQSVLGETRDLGAEALRAQQPDSQKALLPPTHSPCASPSKLQPPSSPDVGKPVIKCV